MGSRTTSLSTLAGLAVLALGVIVLCGWIFGLDDLKGLYGPITMKTNAAICFILTGAALTMHRSGSRRLAQALAAGAATIGALTLSQHIVGWDLGIDQLLFTEVPGAAATASPNRMGLNASVSFMLAGAALVLLMRGTPRAIRCVQWCALTGLAVALLAITGYVYGAEELYGVARYTGIALQTAVGFAILHSGILAAATSHGAMAAFVAEGAGGTLLRRLTPPVVAIPIVLGYLVVLGGNADVFDRGLAQATFALSVIIVLLTLTWHTAAAIEASDRQRQQAERDRDQLLVLERRARDEAERASRLKDQFIAVLSHELRTPLNVMLGRLQTLDMAPDAESRARASAVVARNGRLLGRLVEDLLDLSRVSAGQFDISPAPVDLNALVKSAADVMAAEAAARGIQIVCDLDAAVGAVQADPQRMQQVLTNLISNAVKFTPAGGRIDVRTTPRPAGGVNGAQVTVADTGIGFDAQFASHLFEPFRQADASTRREHGGLGLGLSIARHLAELHGGSLTGSSPGIGQGATFVLTLPVTPAPARSGASATPSDSQCAQT